MSVLHKRISKEVSKYIKQNKSIFISSKYKSNPPCEPKHNRQCMYNAINEFKAKRCVAIAEVCESESGVVHYLCMDGDGEFYDPTLGWSYSGTEYKLIQYIHPEIEHSMGRQLNACKKELIEKACSKSTKAMIKFNPFFNIDEVI